MHREIVLVVVGVRVKAALATRPGAKVLLPALAAVQRARGGRHRVAAFVVQDVGQAVLVRRGGGHGAVRVVGETEGGMGAKGVWDPADSIKEDFGHRRRRSAVVGDAGRRRCGVRATEDQAAREEFEVCEINGDTSAAIESGQINENRFAPAPRSLCPGQGRT